MTSNDEQRPPAKRRRSSRPDASPPSFSTPRRADQGDLWSDEPAPPLGDEPDGEALDALVADLPPPDEEPPASARPAPRPNVVPPPAYGAYEPYDDYDESEYSMLRNPYILAALAVATAIILAIVFVIVFSEGSDTPGTTNVAVASRTATPLPGDLPGVKAEVIANARIRDAPSLQSLDLGLLRTGQEVSVVGRNDDASWYQVIFPGADLTGWVVQSALRLPDGSDDLLEVVGATPIPLPSVEQPTPTPPATPTEEALGPPDISLEVLGNVCPASGPITVALRNVGDVDINSRQIVLTVSTNAGVLKEETLGLTLGVGQIVPVNTGVDVQPPSTVVSIVFANEPQDADPANNVLTCVVSGNNPGPNSTTLPPPVETPDGN